MATIKKYNGSTWENTTARKYETKSEIITPPTTIYTDGTAITAYTIKGNTVQNGTPTPSNPVEVVGVGTLDSGQYKIPISSGGVTTNIYLGSTQTVRQIKKLVLTGEEDWTRTGTLKFALALSDNPDRSGEICYCTHFIGTSKSSLGDLSDGECSTQFSGNRLGICYDSITSADDFKTYLAQQYANGTPVIVYYVLATAETAAVNEPLMKIGDYADSISNAASIPTTEGANSITVDTTVQPSEFTATWTGWHDASVKEWDGSQWS